MKNSSLSCSQSWGCLRFCIDDYTNAAVMCPGTTFRVPLMYYKASTYGYPRLTPGGGSLVLPNICLRPGYYGCTYYNVYQQKWSTGYFLCRVYDFWHSNTQAGGYYCVTIVSPAASYYVISTLCSKPACTFTFCYETCCTSGLCRITTTCYPGGNQTAACNCFNDYGANPSTPFCIITKVQLPSAYTGQESTCGYMYISSIAYNGINQLNCYVDQSCSTPATRYRIGTYGGYISEPQAGYASRWNYTSGTLTCWGLILPYCQSNGTWLTSTNNYANVPVLRLCKTDVRNVGLQSLQTESLYKFGNRMKCCVYGSGSGYMSAYGFVKAVRVCGSIYNASSCAICWTIYQCSQDVASNICCTAAASCLIPSGGYWNFDYTIGQCWECGLAICSYSYGPTGKILFCPTYCSAAGYNTYIGTADINFSYCYNRNNDCCTGTGWGTL